MVGEADRNDRRRARTRRALLDAARRVIGRQGVENVTIQEITDEADVGFGSFYNHFATKEDLLQELLQESSETVHRRKECRKMIEALKKADEIVSSV